VACIEIARTAGTANLVEWAKLALTTPQERVLRMTRVRHDADDHPLAFEEVVLPLGRFFGMAPNGDVPDITELAQRNGLLLGRASERVSIVQATKDVAMHLGIPAGANVLKLDRIAETADGEPVEWRVTFRKI
jgi:DNA-binding GntR family transcriptional regulator